MAEPEQNSLVATRFLARKGRKKFTFRGEEALLAEDGKLHTVAKAIDQPCLLVVAWGFECATTVAARARLPHRIPQIQWAHSGPCVPHKWPP